MVESTEMNNSDELRSRLSQISNSGRIAFGASCCERQLPNYVAFSKMEGWGDIVKINETLDVVWTSVLDERAVDQIDEMAIDVLLTLVPDTEEFSSAFTSLAGDVVSSLIYTIEARKNRDANLENILQVAEVSLSSVFQYLAIVNLPTAFPDVEPEGFDDLLYTLPLLRTEIEAQYRDVSLILNRTLDSNLVAELRATASNLGIQPEKRGLIK